MESLPPELIVEICSHLSLKELKHARLVNKSFARLVTPRLFSSVAIWLQKESVEILVHISQQAHLRKHVKHLRIGRELFLATGEGFEVTYCTSTTFCDDYTSLSDVVGCDCVEMSDENVQQILHDQKWIEEPDGGIELLASALKGLPNLTSVEISGRAPAFTARHPRITPKATLTVFDEYPSSWYNTCGRAQFQFFLRAVLAAGDGFCLRDLTIGDDINSARRALMSPHFKEYAGVIRGMFAPSTEYSSTITSALRTVERLDIIYPISTGPWTDEQSAPLNGFLRCMPLLKRLSFTNSSRFQEHFDMPNAFKDITWEKLQSLKLKGLEFKGRELIESVARHSDTLQTFQLSSARIVHPSFRAFLTKLRARASLEKFILSQDICIYTDAGLFEFPLWTISAAKRADHRALAQALNDFVIARMEDYPTEMLRLHLYRHHSPFENNVFLELEWDSQD